MDLEERLGLLSNGVDCAAGILCLSCPRKDSERQNLDAFGIINFFSTEFGK